jgi:hypothetical protein
MQYPLIQLLAFISWFSIVASDVSWNAETESLTVNWDIPTNDTSNVILDVQLLNVNDTGFMINYSTLSKNSTSNQITIPKQYIPSNNNYYFEVLFKKSEDSKANSPESWRTSLFSISGNSTDNLETCSGASFISPGEFSMWYSSAHPLGLSWSIDSAVDENTFVDYILMSEDQPAFRHSYLDRDVKAGANQDTLPDTVAEKGDRYFIEAVLHEHRHTASAAPKCKFKSGYFKIRDQWGFY